MTALPSERSLRFQILKAVRQADQRTTLSVFGCIGTADCRHRPVVRALTQLQMESSQTRRDITAKSGCLLCQMLPALLKLAPTA